jgi:hypothetical protein
MPSDHHPRELILNFLAHQPDTIRDTLYFQVGFSLHDESFSPDLDFKEIIEKFLTRHQGLRGVARAIQVIALLDYLFTRPRDRFERTLAAQMPPEIRASMKKVILQIPLRRKHFESAEAEWRKLRQSDLSFEALQQSEHIHLVEPEMPPTTQ